MFCLTFLHLSVYLNLIAIRFLDCVICTEQCAKPVRWGKASFASAFFVNDWWLLSFVTFFWLKIIFSEAFQIYLQPFFENYIWVIWACFFGYKCKLWEQVLRFEFSNNPKSCDVCFEFFLVNKILMLCVRNTVWATKSYDLNAKMG